MSDNNAYVNAYIETTVGTVHELMNTILQIKTQLKVATDSNAEKDQLIASLNGHLNSYAAQQQEHDIIRAKYEDMAAKYDSVASKASHVETFMKQIGEMKDLIKEKDEEIKKLRSKKKVAETTNEPNKTTTIEDNFDNF